MPLWKSVRVAVCVALGVSSCADADRIRTVQDVPTDVAVIVNEVWRDVGDRLPWAAECMLPVEVFLTRNVPDGAARYRADEQLIEIEIPTSPARFRESLVHELGHHIDATCDDLEGLRMSFLTAQGFDASQRWDDGDTWEGTPHEHFAEAIVVIVNGDRLLHAERLTLVPNAVDLVKNPPAY